MPVNPPSCTLTTGTVPSMLSSMPSYRFTLLFALAPGEDSTRLLDAFYENGCSDASFGVGTLGMLGGDFVRASSSVAHAMSSACADVTRAVPHARLSLVEPWLGGMTQMAKALHCTRQNVAKHIVGAFGKEGEAFPMPLYIGNPGLWRLDQALSWFVRNTALRVDLNMLETCAEAARLMKDVARV